MLKIGNVFLLNLNKTEEGAGGGEHTSLCENGTFSCTEHGLQGSYWALLPGPGRRWR